MSYRSPSRDVSNRLTNFFDLLAEQAGKSVILSAG